VVYGLFVINLIIRKSKAHNDLATDKLNDIISLSKSIKSLTAKNITTDNMDTFNASITELLQSDPSVRLSDIGSFTIFNTSDAKYSRKMIRKLAGSLTKIEVLMTIDWFNQLIASGKTDTTESIAFLRKSENDKYEFCYLIVDVTCRKTVQIQKIAGLCINCEIDLTEETLGEKILNYFLSF
jgi:hypothetical protein